LAVFCFGGPLPVRFGPLGRHPTRSRRPGFRHDLFNSYFGKSKSVGLRYRNPFAGRPHEAYNRPTTRYDGDAPVGLGFSINQTWGAIKKCWRGYRIAVGREYDQEKALMYARRIRKLQAEQGITIVEFPNLGLCGTTEDDIEWDCP
jgi:hypothetical protein